MSSRSKHMRQLGIQGKIMYKSGSSISFVTNRSDFDKEESSFTKLHANFDSSEACSSNTPFELAVPSEVAVSLEEIVLVSEDENQLHSAGKKDSSSCYAELTPVPTVIVEDITPITENNSLLDPTQETLLTMPFEDNILNYSNQEDPFDDSGSSFKPSNSDVESDSDDLPLARLINNKRPRSDTSKPDVKRAKRGLADPLTWEINKTKLLRMKGEKYMSYKKEKDGRKSKVERKSRQLGERCDSKKCKNSKSKRQCYLIREEDRQQLFQLFWSEMDWRQRKTYVTALVTKSETKQKTTKRNNTRRQTTLFYHLKIDEKLVPVCKKLFLSTLGLGEWSVRYWVKDSDAGIPKIIDKYPAKVKPVNEKKREEIRHFFDKLPKLPSHYCRASTSKFYLEPIFRSYSEVYEIYKKEVESPTGRDVFVSEMKKLNIDIYQPRKDQCDLCFSHKLGQIDNDIYDKHIEEKNKARKEKEKDKEDAISESVSLFTVDVQAVQLVPQLHASMLYFKQKLACHNFTIYNVATKAVVCYVWHEGEGGMESNCFATCLIDFLDNEISQEAKNRPIIFYSDGCSAQNRNALLSNVLLNYSIRNETDIIQKYLVKGHSQMECDSVHSTIEARKKNREIYSPSNYVQIIEDSRRHSKAGPYKVKYVDHTFFLNFSSLKYFNSIRPGKRTGDPCVTDIRALRYTKTDGIQYKLDFDDNWTPHPSRKLLLSDIGTSKKLYDNALPISRDKYNNLQTLKSVIHRDYHNFYDLLKHE